MKFAAVMITMLLLLLPITHDAIAQVDEYVAIPYRITISVDGGIGIPSQPAVFNDLWNAALPASATLGVRLVSWLEVFGFFNYAKWGISEIPAKNAIGILGVDPVEGGAITTMVYGASIKGIALPKNRVSPFAEVGVGLFKASADELTGRHRPSATVVVDVQRNMADAEGVSFIGGGGIQYALNQSWSVYAKFLWTIGFTSDFNPGAIVKRLNAQDPEGGDMQFGALMLGLFFKM